MPVANLHLQVPIAFLELLVPQEHGLKSRRWIQGARGVTFWIADGAAHTKLLESFIISLFDMGRADLGLKVCGALLILWEVDHESFCGNALDPTLRSIVNKNCK